MIRKLITLFKLGRKVAKSDILDINVAKITEQYTSYIELMDAMQVELAGDYLVMAAYLAELKSRMLLPRPVEQT